MSYLSPIISTATILALISGQGVALAETKLEEEENTAPHLVQNPTDPSPNLPSNEQPSSQLPSGEQDTPPMNGETPQIPSGEVEPPQQEIPEGDATDEPEVLVVEVNVEGVEGELEDIVFDATDIQPGRITTRSRLQEDVNAIFATGLFSNVRVVPEDTPLGVRVTFVVEANPVLENVQVETIPDDQQERVLPQSVVNELFSDQYGEILNLQELQSNIEQLNQWYQENGYDLAQVVGSPEVSEDGVVTLTVAEGVIEDIQVRIFDDTGEEIDGQTRDFIITREVELSQGDVFRRQTARSDLERIFGLGIFEDASLSFEPGDDPSKVVLNFDVVEGNTGSIGAGAGVSSATGLFGTVSYQEQNLGGNNQNLSAELQAGGRTLLFNARFRDPWIAGDPHRTSYTADLFRRRSLSVIFDQGETDINLPNGDTPRVIRTGGGLQFGRPLSPDPFTRAEWQVSAGLNYQRVQIEDSDGNIAPVDELGNQLSFDESGSDDLLVLELGAVRDLRNNPRQPTSGSVLRLGVDQSVPIGSGSIFFNRLEGSYSQFFPVDWTNFSDGAETLAFNVQAGTVLGDLPPYEAFSLGGTNSVRGYQQGDVGAGRSFLQATAEYRFPVFNIIRGALFVDVGTDLGTGSNVPGQPAEVRGKPGSGLGYGVGVRVDSPLGPIRLDYGINDQGDDRVHFGIGERF